MENYRASANAGMEIIFKYLKDRMKEKKISQKKIAENLEISETTLMRYFKNETPMTLFVYLQILGILELRPYLIPAEIDNNEMQRIFFS